MEKETQRIWDLFYCAVVGIQFHPANKQLEEAPINQKIMLEKCATIADEMMAIRSRRCP